jgi:ribokinase
VAVVTAEGELSIAGGNAGPVVDSTGAGDAFCGALAALLAEGLDLPGAASMANAAAALSVRKPGARGGMATRSELEAYLKRSPSV